MRSCPLDVGAKARLGICKWREMIEENCETRADQEDPVETETEKWFRIGSKCWLNLQNEVVTQEKHDDVYMMQPTFESEPNKQ